jgi:1-acyl-sn-glycerol-3-phosphate acyltransferase
MKSGAVRLAIGADVPLIPTIVWGGQRVYTKGVKPSFKRSKIPVSVSFGQPITYTRETEIEVAETQLREVMIKMLHDVQEKYPDSHVGQRWAPARLGGTAPAPLN